MGLCIDIFNEVTLKTNRVKVSKQTYTLLKKLSNIGGFKRFGLSIVDESIEIKPNKKIDILGILISDGMFSNTSLIKEHLKIK